MSLAVTITDVDYSAGDSFIVRGTITPSGNYPTTGDTLSFASQDQIKSGSVPKDVRIYSAKPTSAAQTNLFEYNYVPGTTIANGKMQIFTGAAAQTALTELSAGAYPAGVTSDVIQFTATFPKFV